MLNALSLRQKREHRLKKFKKFKKSVIICVFALANRLNPRSIFSNLIFKDYFDFVNLCSKKVLFGFLAKAQRRKNDCYISLISLICVPESFIYFSRKDAKSRFLRNDNGSRVIIIFEIAIVPLDNKTPLALCHAD
jgi:hypothetical protein